MASIQCKSHGHWFESPMLLTIGSPAVRLLLGRRRSWSFLWLDEGTQRSRNWPAAMTCKLCYRFFLVSDCGMSLWCNSPRWKRSWYLHFSDPPCVVVVELASQKLMHIAEEHRDDGAFKRYLPGPKTGGLHVSQTALTKLAESCTTRGVNVGCQRDVPGSQEDLLLPGADMNESESLL